MFLSSRIDESREVVARYREALRDAFDRRSFAMFYADHVGGELEHLVHVDVDFPTLLHHTLEDCRRHGANLKRLLVRALRYRAARSQLVDVLAPALGLAPVIEVADLLERQACPASLREQIALATDHAMCAHRLQLHHGGRAAWIDLLVWLEELPEGVRSRPLLLDYLERLEHAWRDLSEHGANALGVWLSTQRKAQGLGRRILEVANPLARGILLDFNDQGVTWTLGVYLFGDKPIELLFETTLSPPTSAAELGNAVGAAVDRCLADRTVGPLLATRRELRFEIVLPNRWVWAPVDQVLVGANEHEDILPTRFGASYPVVVRPRSWWRPKQGSPAHGAIVRRFQTKRDHLRTGKSVEIRTLDCPTSWTMEDLEVINESPEVVGIALACDRTTIGDPEKLLRCLRAHVLAIVWDRSGVAPEDADARARLGRLLEPIEDAPQLVQARRLRQRTDLSLIWHVDAIEPPAHEPFEPPEIARKHPG